MDNWMDENHSLQLLGKFITPPFILLQGSYLHNECGYAIRQNTKRRKTGTDNGFGHMTIQCGTKFVLAKWAWGKGREPASGGKKTGGKPPGPEGGRRRRVPSHGQVCEAKRPPIAETKLSREKYPVFPPKRPFKLTFRTSWGRPKILKKLLSPE